MTKQLVEEIMQLEAEAELQLVKAKAEHDAIIKKAHEKALLLVQDAEHALGAEEESLIKQKTKELETEKAKAIKQAQTDAQALAQTLSKRVPKAADMLLSKFMEYAANVS
jgi:vacuolar-type H+-ATPase subunit H